MTRTRREDIKYLGKNLSYARHRSAFLGGCQTNPVTRNRQQLMLVSSCGCDQPDQAGLHRHAPAPGEGGQIDSDPQLPSLAMMHEITSKN